MARNERENFILRYDRRQRDGRGTFVDRPFVVWPVSGSCRETLAMMMMMMMTTRRFEERGILRVKITSIERPVKRKEED